MRISLTNNVEFQKQIDELNKIADTFAKSKREEARIGARFIKGVLCPYLVQLRDELRTIKRPDLIQWSVADLIANIGMAVVDTQLPGKPVILLEGFKSLMQLALDAAVRQLEERKKAAAPPEEKPVAQDNSPPAPQPNRAERRRAKRKGR